MKKRSAKVITVIAAVIMLLSLCSCGSGIKGTWQLTSVTIGDDTYDMEQLADAVGSGASSDVSVLLVIDGDGTFTLTDDENSDSDETGTYEEKDGSYIFKINGQDDVSGSLEDGKLVLSGADDAPYDSLTLEKK